MTTTPEDLSQAMHQRVALFRMLRHRLFVHSGELRDLAGELLIEKLPSFAARQPGSHQTAACAIFAFHGDDLEHWPPPLEAAFSMITRILNRGDGNKCAALPVSVGTAETKQIPYSCIRVEQLWNRPKSHRGSRRQPPITRGNRATTSAGVLKL